MEPNKSIGKEQIKLRIKEDFETNLPRIVERYYLIKPNGIQPATHFSSVFSECRLLYVYGYYYAAISLSQSVAEALVKFCCEKNGWKPMKNFVKNINMLLKREKINENTKQLFLKIWENRDDYHHLNANIEKSNQKLETLAKEKLEKLFIIEKEIFGFSLKDGKIIPKYYKYWGIKNEEAPVFLDLV